MACKAIKKVEILQCEYARNRNGKEWRAEDAWRLNRYRKWMNGEEMINSRVKDND